MYDIYRNREEDKFLGECIVEQLDVTLYLTNGFRMTGNIIGADDRVICFLSGDKPQMIYKHAISTLMMDNSPTDQTPFNPSFQGDGPTAIFNNPPIAGKKKWSKK